MKNNVKSTLAGLLDIPQLRPWDLSWMTLGNLHKAQSQFRNEVKHDQPYADREAIEFYTLNHLMAIIAKHRTPNQLLSVAELEIATQYRATVIKQAQRVFYYMALITTREVRHAWEGNDPTSATVKKFVSEVGADVMDMQEKIRGNGWTSAVAIMEDSDMMISEWFDGVEYLFNHGKFSGGFGGKPWPISRTA